VVLTIQSIGLLIIIMNVVNDYCFIFYYLIIMYSFGQNKAADNADNADNVNIINNIEKQKLNNTVEYNDELDDIDKTNIKIDNLLKNNKNKFKKAKTYIKNIAVIQIIIKCLQKYNNCIEI